MEGLESTAAGKHTGNSRWLPGPALPPLEVQLSHLSKYDDPDETRHRAIT